MFEYTFLQQYWWFLVALLGGLLVFLMFVQGANTMIFSHGKTESEREMIVNSTGRKWELTFTTLVTFGGAFFASFPLFYSTSFGGAYWLWVLILVSFVFQAVSYEFQNKTGNLLGKNTFRTFLLINGFAGPFLVGAAVATFFTGSDFIVDKAAILTDKSPVISSWGNSWHGIEALACIWNVVLGLAVVFLTRILGALYMMNNIGNEELFKKLKKKMLPDIVCFLVTFLLFVGYIISADGFAVNQEGTVSMEKYKYLHNLLQMPLVSGLFIVGVLSVLYGIGKTLFVPNYTKGIWWAGSGSVIVVVSLFLLAGYNSTAYYPSTTDLQSSLTLANSSSSAFTLKAMTIVSFLIPAVLAYISYVWKSMDASKISEKEINNTEEKY